MFETFSKLTKKHFRFLITDFSYVLSGCEKMRGYPLGYITIYKKPFSEIKLSFDEREGYFDIRLNNKIAFYDYIKNRNPDFDIKLDFDKEKIAKLQKIFGEIDDIEELATHYILSENELDKVMLKYSEAMKKYCQDLF